MLRCRSVAGFFDGVDAHRSPKKIRAPSPRVPGVWHYGRISHYHKAADEANIRSQNLLTAKGGDMVKSSGRTGVCPKMWAPERRETTVYRRKRLTLMPVIALAALSLMVALPTLSGMRLYAATAAALHDRHRSSGRHALVDRFGPRRQRRHSRRHRPHQRRQPPPRRRPRTRPTPSHPPVGRTPIYPNPSSAPASFTTVNFGPRILDLK